MAKAERASASAKLLLAAEDNEGACNRAYYAMFTAARLALASSGEAQAVNAARTHAGLISLFSLRLVKTGRVPVELGRALNRVEEIRLIADYRGDAIESEQAAWAVDQAGHFVRFVRDTFLPIATPDS